MSHVACGLSEEGSHAFCRTMDAMISIAEKLLHCNCHTEHQYRELFRDFVEPSECSPASLTLPAQHESCTNEVHLGQDTSAYDKRVPYVCIVWGIVISLCADIRRCVTT